MNDNDMYKGSLSAGDKDDDQCFVLGGPAG